MCTKDVSAGPRSEPNNDPKKLFLRVGGGGGTREEGSSDRIASPSTSSFERSDFGRGVFRILRRTGGDCFRLQKYISHSKLDYDNK